MSELMNKTIDNLIQNNDIENQIDILIQEGWKKKLAIGLGAAAGAAASSYGAYKGLQHLRRREAGLNRTGEWVVKTAHYVGSKIGEVSLKTVQAGIKTAFIAKGQKEAGIVIADAIGDGWKKLKAKGDEITAELLSVEALWYLHQRWPKRINRRRWKQLIKFSETPKGNKRLKNAYIEAKTSKLTPDLILSFWEHEQWTKGLSPNSIMRIWRHLGLEVDWVKRVKLKEFPNLDMYFKIDPDNPPKV